MNEDKIIMVTVFSTSNSVLFQIAKTILNDNRIKFQSNGEYTFGILNARLGAGYPEIKVYPEDEETSKNYYLNWKQVIMNLRVNLKKFFPGMLSY